MIHVFATAVLSCGGRALLPQMRHSMAKVAQVWHPPPTLSLDPIQRKNNVIDVVALQMPVFAHQNLTLHFRMR
eukprot:scaffold30887_cov24-Prasinocladus_malaysianus.AAC.3